jgi:hypothetical protein
VVVSSILFALIILTFFGLLIRIDKLAVKLKLFQFQIESHLRLVQMLAKDLKERKPWEFEK